jgi:hypothetical protein
MVGETRAQGPSEAACSMRMSNVARAVPAVNDFLATFLGA